VSTTTRRLTLLTGLLGTLIFGGCGAERHQLMGACDAHRDGAALATPRLIAFGLRSAALETTIFYVCLRPAGRALAVGVDGLSSVYGSDATTGGFAAGGTYLVAQSSTGEADFAICARYSNPLRCPPARYWLTVVDAQTGRRAHVPIYTSPPVRAFVPFPVMLAVSSNGALAWLQTSTVGVSASGRRELWATVLRAVGRTHLAPAPMMIDAGRIDPASLRFTGQTLHWLRDRRAHHRTLH
jgi:hypothetical protein